MQHSFACQLTINMNHSLEAPPPTPSKTSRQFVFTCELLKGPHMIFSEAESLGSGGRVPALGGRFHALQCLGRLERAAAAIRWKIDEGEMSGIQNRKLIFFFQVRQEGRGGLGDGPAQSTNELNYGALQSCISSYPGIQTTLWRSNVASRAGGSINSKEM